MGSQAVKQAGTHLPPGEGNNLVTSHASQAVQSQAGAHLPSGEGSNLATSQAVHSQASAHLPPREGSSSVATTQAVPPIIPSDSASSQAGSEATTNIPAGETPSQADNNLPSSQAGSQVTTRSGRQRAPRLPRGTALLPRQTALVPGKTIPHLTPQIGFPKGLHWKILTQNGSLTYPANL